MLSLINCRIRPIACTVTCLCFLLVVSDIATGDDGDSSAPADSLEQKLLREDAKQLAAESRRFGSATRGAILFHQPVLACTKCHSVGQRKNTLGPNLAEWKERVPDEHIVEAILQPSKKLRKGYEAVTVVTLQGKQFTGLIQSETKTTLTLRDPSFGEKPIAIAVKDIDFRKKAGSIMPKGLVNQLANRQQFLDITKYLLEVANGGAKRARELQPPESLFALPPLPEYEKRIDHAGLISSLDGKSFERGKAIYERLCINCHGTVKRAGNLPTSLRFASGRFKNGSDPYSMYQTLTHGFGMMVPQRWMVPQQKYDVIHYVREVYLKPHNPSQFVKIDAGYLTQLPKGNTRGPKPVKYAPWEDMNYGPHLIGTYEAGRDGTNIAYKGIAVRLDNGPGGVARGKHWMVFDHDTLRVAAAWSGDQFIDYNGIMFNGRHNIHPRIPGDIHFANPTAPGWANPETGRFDDPRFRGRDGKPYGPLPRKWARYRGLYHYGNRVIVSYTVGKTSILEMPGLDAAGGPEIFTRTFHIGPRQRDLILQVARRNDASTLQALNGSRIVRFGGKSTDDGKKRAESASVTFDGRTYLVAAKPKAFDFTGRDYTITARFRTRKGGTLLAKTAPGERWVRDGKALFVRGGRLVFDIGWVGAVRSSRSVNDGKWHDVAMTWEKKTGRVRLYIDGKLDANGSLRPKKPVRKHETRIGFAAPNFPRPQSHFQGEIASLKFYGTRLSEEQIAGKTADEKSLVADWKLSSVGGDSVKDESGKGHAATVVRGNAKRSANAALFAGLTDGLPGAKWFTAPAGNLRLRIPAGEKPLKFTLLLATADSDDAGNFTAAKIGRPRPVVDLTELTKGGPPRWPQMIETKPTVLKNGGPFEVDVLSRPTKNPWSCRVRLTGLDFFPGGKRMAVCTWDGDVWLVDGWAGDSPKKLTWKRIASGLFQPLGLKIVAGKIYVGCRDEIAILHDLNGDGETDFYENFNNDHQVTEHFHEFAMGLQTDDEGNFYYAKSARHALPAIVPHHGTLLRVSRDGLKTEILATGFRAANGVCLNPDGTFFVTDQEGHWTPKNRINWVEKGGFYGNMLGYHNVKDTSDSAMKQPLCWITNSFDRSPAELLWVSSRKWGPLKGSLLSLSYGYGKVFIVPHEKVGGQMQGGMCELPLPTLPTGIIRGRFHPQDGQLYVCGMFAWAGSRQQPGGLYRIRYTGKPVHLPVGLKAHPGRVEVRFSGPIKPGSATDAANYIVRTWSLKRTKNYGSKHYDERRLNITKATISQDGKTVTLHIPDVKPTWCMEIRYALQGSKGERVDGTIHNTIHKLAD